MSDFMHFRTDSTVELVQSAKYFILPTNSVSPFCVNPYITAYIINSLPFSPRRVIIHPWMTT